MPTIQQYVVTNVVTPLNMTHNIKSTSGSVIFRIKDPKSKTDTPIILDYSFGRGNRLRYSTGFKVLPNNWDSGKQRIRAKSTIKNREDINYKLLELKSEFIKEVGKLELSLKINKKELRRILDEVSGRKVIKEDRPQTFFEFADSYIESRKSQLENAKSIRLSPITVKSYQQTINRLKDFNKEKQYALDFHNINLDFYYSFIGFLEEGSYSLNTIGKHIKNLKTILNRATALGLNLNLQYKQNEFKTFTEVTTEIYLNTDEIDKFYNIDLSDKPHWEKARDIFIIGYYTGQRVSDYNRLTNECIKSFNEKKVFEIFQQKTNKTVYIPIHKRVWEIMEKRYNGKLPSMMAHKDINKYIKLVGEKLEIDEVIIYEYTEGGVRVKEPVPKYNMIETHTARRSFCTNLYLMKIPIIDIMAITGHTTEKEFYKYIRITPKERAVKIANNAFFGNN